MARWLAGWGNLGSVWATSMATLVAAACAAGDATNNSPGFSPVQSGGSSGAGGTPDAATRSSSSGAGGAGSSGGGGAEDATNGGPGDDSGGSDGAAGEDGGDEGGGATSSSSSGSGGAGSSSSGGSTSTSSSSSGSSSGATSYSCVTTLSPAPVCDQEHDYCLCVANAQCNSNGLSIAGINGGCNSQRCASQSDCTGAAAVDSAGCSVVGVTCNLPGNQACPSNLFCATGTSVNGHQDMCGGQPQCCWCTSDSGCPVSGKCINDSTLNNCSGKGPCTGTGTNWDGMHCELTSPGIPMCTP